MNQMFQIQPKRSVFIQLCFLSLLMTNIACYQPRIIAHRGYWKAAGNAQNSLEAIQKANEHQFYGSEFDVRLTQDGIPIVYHDHEVNGKDVESILLKDLQSIKLYNGEVIPTLESYLKTSQHLNHIRLIAELKPQATPELETILVDKTIDLIHKYQLQNQTDYISFSANICDLIKSKIPKAHVQYLNGDFSPKEIKNRGWDGFDYNYNILLQNSNWIKEAHELGLTTNAWTVNDKETFDALKNLKIQMITTDQPLKYSQK